MTRILGKDISMILQEPLTSFNPVMTIGSQIIKTMLHLLRLSKEEAKKRALDLLDMLGIPDPARTYDQYPHELSGGSRQRVMIPIFIACNVTTIENNASTFTMSLFETMTIILMKMVKLSTYNLSVKIILWRGDRR